MSLDPRQYAHFVEMLSDLKPHIGSMKDVPAQFVRDQIARNEEYGVRTYVSPKQFSWLQRLHDEFIGTSEGPDDNDPRFSGEADSDEIPF